MQRLTLYLFLMGIFGIALWVVSPRTTKGQNGEFTLALPLVSRTDSAPLDQIVGVYAAGFDGDMDIYLHRLSEELETPLTINTNYHDDFPQWSPDNERVLYRSYLTGTLPEQGNLYVVDIGGSEIITLTQNANVKTEWNWNARGDISFLETQSNGQVDLFMVPVGEITPTRLLTDVVPTPLIWSSDGEHLAFTAAWDGDNEAYTITPDSLTLTQITTNAVNDTAAAWVLEDSYLVVRRSDGTDDNLWLANIDGSGDSQLTTATRGESFDSVSPDSNLIVYIQDDISGNEPYRYPVVMNLLTNTTYPINLGAGCLGSDCHVGNSAWREDNRTIAWEIEGSFISDPNGIKSTFYSILPYETVENVFVSPEPEQPIWVTDWLFHVTNSSGDSGTYQYGRTYRPLVGGGIPNVTRQGTTVQIADWRWLAEELRP